MKEMNLPVSFGCDRDKHTSDAKNQTGFLNMFVLPLAQLIKPLFNPMIKLLENDNREHWNNLENENITTNKPYSKNYNKNNNNSYNDALPIKDSIQSQ